MDTTGSTSRVKPTLRRTSVNRRETILTSFSLQSSLRSSSSIFRSGYVRGIIGLLAVLCFQGACFFFVPLNSTCTVTSYGRSEGEQMSRELTVFALLPLYISGWFMGFYCGHIFRPQTQYRSSRLHFWGTIYAFSLLLSCVLDGTQMLWRCNEGWVRILFTRVFKANFGFSFVPVILLGWLSLLKLFLVRSAVPKAERLGVFAFIILFISCLICLGHALCEAAQLGVEWPFSLMPNILRYAIALSLMLLSGCVAFAMETSAQLCLAEASELDIDGEVYLGLVRAAERSRAAWKVVMVSGTSSAIFFMVWEHSSVWVMRPFQGRLLVLSIWLVDTVLNVAACAALSGKSDLFNQGSISIVLRMGMASHAAKRRRQIEKRLINDVGSSTGSAVVLAALMKGASPKTILAAGVKRFRCIRWEVLAKKPELIVGGVPLDGVGPAPGDLYSLSESCELGDCDVFWSHSWHDDGATKWEALKCWCEEFKVITGRFPRLWFDKVCVDQNNIEEDLQCLPIFLAGCNAMLVTSGSTYHKRLWCCAEMLIYRAMLVADSARSPPIMWLIGNSESDCQDNLQGWFDFSVDDCDCFKSSDKMRFLQVVDSYPGGAEGFNRFIRNIARSFQRNFAVDYEEHYCI